MDWIGNGYAWLKNKNFTGFAGPGVGTAAAPRKRSLEEIEFGCGDKEKLRQQLDEYLRPADDRTGIFADFRKQEMNSMRFRSILDRIARGEAVTMEDRRFAGQRDWKALQSAELINSDRKAFSLSLKAAGDRGQAKTLYNQKMFGLIQMYHANTRVADPESVSRHFGAIRHEYDEYLKTRSPGTSMLKKKILYKKPLAG